MTNQNGACKIASIGVPTCNRVEGLRRALMSYIENGRRHGRRNDFVIVDDSPKLETRLQCRRMLQSLSREHGVEVWYAGLEEKMRFAKQLIDQGASPPEVVKFALFDTERSGLVTIGANMNATLLHTVGDAVLSVDDDTVCRIGVAPDQQPGLALASERRFSASHPCEVWSFPDRETALGAVSYEERDLLALHEAVLGKEVAACIEEQGCDSENIGGGMNGGLTGDPVTGSGQVLVTLNGLLGDCGWGSPSNFLLLEGESLERILDSESAYRSACRSREMLRVADRLTLTRKSENMMATFFGIDNRRLLPPFIPVTRGADYVFGVTLSQSFEVAYFAHLPWTLWHLPVESRRFSAGEISRSASGVDVDLLVTTLIRSKRRQSESRSGGCDARQSLSQLGFHLERIGSLPAPEFDQFVYGLLAQESQAFISYLEDRLRNRGESHRFWIDEVRRVIELMQSSFSRPEVIVPLDLLTRRGWNEARELSQRLVRKFGQLLARWPELVEAARAFRAQGHRLAQPL